MNKGLSKGLLSAFFLVGLLGTASTAHADVEYVRVCSLFGEGFHYIPGTDICVNEQTGQTREVAGSGTWGSLSPTSNQWHWAQAPALECTLGRLVLVGNFRPTDFKINDFTKYQTAPQSFKLQPGEFITRVIMSGGFYDPLQPSARTPSLSPQQFCLRVADPNYSTVDLGAPAVHPPFCSPDPLGCVSNSQILGTPAFASLDVMGTPVVHYNTDVNGRVTGGPNTCGSQFVVTTGMGTFDPTTVIDPSNPTVPIPASGLVSVWACIEQ